MKKNVLEKEEKIVDGKYLATDKLCRWISVFKGNSSELSVGEKRVKKMMENGEVVFLLPFGKYHLFFRGRINGRAMEFHFESPYRDGEIHTGYMGILLYSAIELVKRGDFEKYQLMRKYSDYYNDLRKKIPENYEIHVNGKFAEFGFETLESLVDRCIEEARDFDHFSVPDCNKCPLRKLCEGAFGSLDIERLIDDEEKMREVTLRKLYIGLRNAGVDALYVLSLYVSEVCFDVYRKYYLLPKLIPENLNAGIILGFTDDVENFAKILSLSKGRIYRNPGAFLSENPGARIFSSGDSGEMTDYIVIREEVKKSVLKGEKNPVLEKVLEKYEDWEKLVVYLSFLKDSVETKEEKGPESVYLNQRVPKVEIMKMLMTSNIFKDEFVNVDFRNLSIIPTYKAVRVLYSALKGVRE